MASWGSVANNIQGAYHQVNPFDSGRTYKTNQAASAKYDYRPPAATSPSPSKPTGPSATDQALAALRAQSASNNAANAAFNAQMAAMPRLPKFDWSGAQNQALQQATGKVNAVYADNLNRYLEKKNMVRGQETVKTTRNKEDIGTSLTQALADSLLNRNRTEEDVTNKLTDITGNENSFQRQEGRQFDQARTALMGDVANAGLTESGIGQGKIQEAVVDRNIASEDQTREFTNQKRDTEIFRTRTMQDLDTGEARSKGSAARKTEDADIALRQFMENQDYEEKDYRATQEVQRGLDINDAQSSAYKAIVSNTINALLGSGARAQDVELFSKIYG